MDFKVILRKIRDRLPYGSLTECAAHCGISVQLLSHYLSGKVYNQEIVDKCTDFIIALEKCKEAEMKATEDKLNGNFPFSDGE